jgi:hypothetical protein
MSGLEIACWLLNKDFVFSPVHAVFYEFLTHWKDGELMNRLDL